jgi:hypothetical protein
MEISHCGAFSTTEHTNREKKSRSRKQNKQNKRSDSIMRSLSPFPRRRARRDREQQPSVLMKQSEIEYYERSRSSMDPCLLETSAIEVVLESSSPPPSPPAYSSVRSRRISAPALTHSSASEETTPPSRQDFKRKSFKQKFMQKKATPVTPPPPPPEKVTKKVTASEKSTKSVKSSSTKTTSKTSKASHELAKTSKASTNELAIIDPLEPHSRRCFPFAQPPSRGRMATTGPSSPLRRRARSAGRRVAQAPSPKRAAAAAKRAAAIAAATAKAAATHKERSQTPASQVPLIDPTMRASTEDEEEQRGPEERPGRESGDRLSPRPKLLRRLEAHAPPTPSVAGTTVTRRAPNQIAVGRQKSAFSEISAPSTVATQPHFPAMAHMEESLVQATRQGKKIDRVLVYQTMLRIADSLESPEEQAAMHRELTLLIEGQQRQDAVRRAAQVPADTFPTNLSDGLGPSSSPGRTTSMGSKRSKSGRRSKTSKVSREPNLASQKAPPFRTKDRMDDCSDDGFTEFADDLESQSSRSSASTDTIHFLSEMFNIGSFFSTDDEKKKEVEPEAWNNFEPPPSAMASKKSRRRRSPNQNKTAALSDSESDMSGHKAPAIKRIGKPRYSESSDRRAWWRKKAEQQEWEANRERSLMREEDNLSLSSIESLQYKPQRGMSHLADPDESPMPMTTEDLPSIPNRRRRSKSLDTRRDQRLV